MAYNYNANSTPYGDHDIQQGQLPYPWVSQFSQEHGTDFYVNVETSESTWIRPDVSTMSSSDGTRGMGGEASSFFAGSGATPSTPFYTDNSYGSGQQQQQTPGGAGPDGGPDGERGLGKVAAGGAVLWMAHKMWKDYQKKNKPNAFKPPSSSYGGQYGGGYGGGYGNKPYGGGSSGMMGALGGAGAAGGLLNSFMGSGNKYGKRGADEDNSAFNAYGGGSAPAVQSNGYQFNQPYGSSPAPAVGSTPYGAPSYDSSNTTGYNAYDQQYQQQPYANNAYPQQQQQPYGNPSPQPYGQPAQPYGQPAHGSSSGWSDPRY